MRIDDVYDLLSKLCTEQYKREGRISGISAGEISSRLKLQRTNVSSDLNRLFHEGKIDKIAGKPVLYKLKEGKCEAGKYTWSSSDVFTNVVGAGLSLKNAVQQAKAAIIYPPKGLHTLLLGETGTGKSMFAEVMYEFARNEGRIKNNAPFVAFNCADYSNNPQLLMSHMFGVKKGAYTGADRNREGLVEKADGGILFLDEVHRLPPEGQEMLFYLMDKGLYRKLGESESQHRADILIIGATTENAESALLKTFTRRIPMVINLPSLKDRTLRERYDIIKSFFEDEASKIKSGIAVTSNALKALLLYDCPGNIGQLKSDIKLCCAKAFLSFMMRRDSLLYIHSEDLPNYIRRGLFKYKDSKSKVDRYVGDSHTVFSAENCRESHEQGSASFNFYQALEEKRNVLEINGLEDKDIKLIMDLDIENYLKKYMLQMEKNNLEDLYKIVDKRVVDIIDRFLYYASDKLKREFSPKILHGLSMHIASYMERMEKGKRIENHRLQEIKTASKAEYELAERLRADLQKELEIEFSDDETGFIAMFLCLDNERGNDKGEVGVLVAIHGESAATSIADVSNRLLGADYIVGYNMPLEQKPEAALENITDIVRGLDKGKGVLLMVDMGSLALFGDMIHERYGIPVKTVQMVSTPMVIEAGRRAMLNASLEEVYEAVAHFSPYAAPDYEHDSRSDLAANENIIITACITGEGTALKLKAILEKKLDLKGKNIRIIPINIISGSEYKRKIEKLKSKNNILAVVSAIKPEDDSLTYISTAELFDGEKLNGLKKKIDSLDALRLIDNIEDVVRENINIDAAGFIDAFKKCYAYLLAKDVNLNDSTLTGLMLHLACVIERVKDGKELNRIKNCQDIIINNPEEYLIIKNIVKIIESEFSIRIIDEECASIMRIVFCL